MTSPAKTESIAVQTDQVFTIQLTLLEKLSMEQILKSVKKTAEKEEGSLMITEAEEDDDVYMRIEKCREQIELVKKWLSEIKRSDGKDAVPERLGFDTGIPELDEYVNDKITDPQYPRYLLIIETIETFIKSSKNKDVVEEVEKNKTSILDSLRSQYLTINARYNDKILLNLTGYGSQDSDDSSYEDSEDSESDSDSDSDDDNDSGNENSNSVENAPDDENGPVENQDDIVITSTPIIEELPCSPPGENVEEVVVEIELGLEEKEKPEEVNDASDDSVIVLDDDEEPIVDSTPLIREIVEPVETLHSVLNARFEIGEKGKEEEEMPSNSGQDQEEASTDDNFVLLSENSMPRTSTPKSTTPPPHDDDLGFQDFFDVSPEGRSSALRKRLSGKSDETTVDRNQLFNPPFNSFRKNRTVGLGDKKTTYYFRLVNYLDDIEERKKKAESNIIDVEPDVPNLDNVPQGNVPQGDAAIIANDQRPVAIDDDDDEIICVYVKRRRNMLYIGPHFAPPYALRDPLDNFNSPKRKKSGDSQETGRGDGSSKRMKKSNEGNGGENVGGNVGGNVGATQKKVVQVDPDVIVLD